MKQKLEEKVEKKKLIPVLPTIRQLVHSKLAQYCLHNRGNDLYFFFEALNLLRSAVGEGILKEHYGDNYQKVAKNLDLAGIKISQIKFYYDQMEKGDEKTMKKYLKEMETLPMIQKLMFDVFIVLVNNSQMKRLHIPSSAFIKELKKDFRPRLAPRRMMQEEMEAPDEVGGVDD